MSEEKGKAFAMPRSYDVTVAAFRRFERRSGVSLFSALADVIKEVGEAVDGVALAKSIFTDSVSLAAFIYECGLDQKQRDEMPFEDWLGQVQVADLFGEYDRAILALFTFSPSQKTETREAGSQEKAEATPAIEATP